MDIIQRNPVRPAFDSSDVEGLVVVNIGPSHPATHGTLQVIAALDGERVKRIDVHCGYLHRGFEKECESHSWHNLIPYVDRLNYCSALINDFAYCEAVEAMMGIEITPRCKYLRTLLSEYSRVADHLTCVAASLMELGAMTAFLYLVMVRDYIYEHLAALTGARVTHSYGRIGGLAADLPDGWLVRLAEILDEYEVFVARIHGLMDRNRIFIDRTRNVGVISAADAINYGFTGPILRSAGVPRDLRKDMPYLAYAELDFEVPVGINGDNYDRYYVRMREMDESVHMIRQLVDMLPAGPINVDDRRCTFPDKTLVYSEIESLINHFKLVIDGPRVPAGDVYLAHEAPNGELGFYLVSTGEGTPYKVHVRAPSFVHMGGLPMLLEGYQLADIIPTFGSVNMIGRRVRSMKHLIPEFDILRARFPAGFDSSLVLPCLRRIQEDRGHIGNDDIDALVDYLGVPRIQVEEVLSFYTQYRRAPIGRWHLQVCRNVSCSMRGAERILATLAEKIGVAVGETTADGRFSLSTVECLGSCGTAPVVMVNDTHYENVGTETLDEFLARFA